MTVVPGRILPPPGIKYNSGSPEVDEKASWNLRNVKFAKGGKLSDWAVLLIKDGNSRDEFSGPSDPELINTVRGFATMCRNSGMVVDKKDPIIAVAALPQKDYSDPTRRAAISHIEKTLKSMKKPTMVLVLLSNGDKHVYSGLKHLCDSYLDLGKLYNARLSVFCLNRCTFAKQLCVYIRVKFERREVCIPFVDDRHPL
jgi:hypothetical protein